MVHSPFDALFTPGTRFAREYGGPLDISIRVLGELKVPTGRILAVDPLATELGKEGACFSRQAPTGVFPVELALAHTRPGTQRVACARIRFGPPGVRAVRWEAALCDGEEVADDGIIPGYGVDAGMGCFLDEAARAFVDEATSERWLAILETNSQNEWTWHSTELGQANLIMFSTNGDGIYSSYWGFDAQGQIVELVTDFDTITEYDYERIELPWPLPPGKVKHPFLEKHKVTVRMKRRLWGGPVLCLSARHPTISHLLFSDGT